MSVCIEIVGDMAIIMVKAVHAMLRCIRWIPRMHE